MCYSAEASFTASVILGGIGYASTRIASSKSQLLLAAIPCLFAIQQFCEGITWLHLRGVLPASAITMGAQLTFMVFAYALWPFWIPFALIFNESHPIKKKIISLFALAAVAAAVMNLYTLDPLEITPRIVSHSIQYEVGAPLFKKVIYLMIALIPCLISSLHYMWAFGLLMTAASLISEQFYTTVFTSVWCFAAALISVSIYMIIRVNQEEGSPLSAPTKGD